MITRKLLVVGTLATTVLLAFNALGPPAPAAHAATRVTAQATAAINGTLQAGFGTTAPTTLQMQTTDHGLMTVAVSTATQIVRRYNGRSALDELSPGDTLSVVNVASGTTTGAAIVKDWTIQRAFTRNVGRITGISTDLMRLTVRVLADSRYTGQNPFDEGQTIYVAVTPAMSVTLSDGSKGTVQDNLSPGLVITALGVYNRASRTFQNVSRLRVWSPTAGQTTEVHGILQSGFSASAPTILTLRTPHTGLVTVSVAPTTRLVRRFNGASLLVEFSAGDVLAVAATYQGGSSYSATAIKDVSIQGAYSFMVGRITSIRGTQVTATVLAAMHSRQDPFWVGESVTLHLSAMTMITLANGTAGTAASLQPGMRIATVGVVNSMAHTFIAVPRIRILR
jgi:hypothetical protein